MPHEVDVYHNYNLCIRPKAEHRVYPRNLHAIHFTLCVCVCYIYMLHIHLFLHAQDGIIRMVCCTPEHTAILYA